MIKEYVYFFKHINVTGVKIGKTSGESVLNRFNSFKTSSPFGAEILGFYEAVNGYKEEKELHQRFASHRLSGEFFDISLEMVNSIVAKKNKTLHTVTVLLNEWLSDEENDIEAFKLLLLKKIQVVQKESIEADLLVKYIKKDLNGFMTTTDIYNFLIENGYKVSLRSLGLQLRRLCYDRVKPNKIFGYRCSILG